MPSRRFYIASSLDNAEAVRQLACTLRARGHVHTYDWTTHGAVFKPSAEPEDNVAAMRDVARSEMKGVTTADVVIVLLPGGRGTHVEMGGALAAGKRVLVVGDKDIRTGHQGRDPAPSITTRGSSTSPAFRS
jgi:nucleoside 2-deoxyribosyltransferase